MCILDRRVCVQVPPLLPIQQNVFVPQPPKMDPRLQQQQALAAAGQPKVEVKAEGQPGQLQPAGASGVQPAVSPQQQEAAATAAAAAAAAQAAAAAAAGGDPAAAAAAAEAAATAAVAAAAAAAAAAAVAVPAPADGAANAEGTTAAVEAKQEPGVGKPDRRLPSNYLPPCRI